MNGWKLMQESVKKSHFFVTTFPRTYLAPARKPIFTVGSLSSLTHLPAVFQAWRWLLVGWCVSNQSVACGSICNIKSGNDPLHPWGQSPRLHVDIDQPKATNPGMKCGDAQKFPQRPQPKWSHRLGQCLPCMSWQGRKDTRPFMEQIPSEPRYHPKVKHSETEMMEVYHSHHSYHCCKMVEPWEKHHGNSISVLDFLDAVLGYPTPFVHPVASACPWHVRTGQTCKIAAKKQSSALMLIIFPDEKILGPQTWALHEPEVPQFCLT